MIEPCRPSALAADPVGSTAPTAEIGIRVRQKTHVCGVDQGPSVWLWGVAAGLKRGQRWSLMAGQPVFEKKFGNGLATLLNKKDSTRERMVAGAAVFDRKPELCGY